MADERYVIVKTTAGWMISFNSEENGPYKTMAEAMLCAIDAAVELGRSGINTEVCLMGEHGHVQTEWAYPRCKRARSAVILPLPLRECATVLSTAAALRG
jgi:hypothetical protein